jgi:hypothetical protein
MAALAIYAVELLNRLMVAQQKERRSLPHWVTNVLLPTYLKKNHDYGNSFDRSMDDFGPVVAKIRVGDKVSRYLSLTEAKADGSTPQVKEESIADTLLDMCNYCIMSLMWYNAERTEDYGN